MVVRRSARAFAGVCPSGAGSECSWGRGFSPGSRGRAFSFFSGALRVSAGWSLCVAWLGSVDASTGRAAVGFPGWVLGRRLVSAIKFKRSASRTIFELRVPVVAVLGRVGAALNGYGREFRERSRRIVCDTCEPPVTGKSVRRVCRPIDLISSSAINYIK